MKKHAVLACVAALAAAGLGLSAGTARADQSPSNCNGNGLNVNITRDVLNVRNQDKIHYTVSISNLDDPITIACDVSDLTVTLQLPNRETGQPEGGQIVTIPAPDIKAGTLPEVIGTYDYTVDLDPAARLPAAPPTFPTEHPIPEAVVEVKATGTLHDAPISHPNQTVAKRVGSEVGWPSIDLVKSASPTSGDAPLTVVYSYGVTNTSPDGQPLSNVSVDDDLCSPATYQSGDSNGDNLLQVGETWIFTCGTVHPDPGSYTDTAIAHGTPPGGPPVDSPPRQVTVTVKTPPTPPETPTPTPTPSPTPTPVPPPPPAPTPTPAPQTISDKPLAHCVALPKSLSVRAKELTKLKVHVSGTSGATKVKVSGAGIKKTFKTNAHGDVTISVRPKKSGKLKISSPSCAKVESVSVKAARKVVTHKKPQVTG